MCDLNTFQVLGQINLPAAVTQNSGSGRPALLRWGSDGLAFHDGTRLCLLRSPVIAP